MGDARRAFDGLLSTLAELGDRFAGEEWWIGSPDDEAEAVGVLLAHLATGYETQWIDDPACPTFREIVTPWRKALGDNADARYHDAPVHPAGQYVMRGRVAGAVYVSITVEAGAEGGRFPTGTVGILNDTRFTVDRDGWFDVTIGGPSSDLPLAPDASRLTIRHYFEGTGPAPRTDLGLTLTLVGGDVPAAPRTAGEASVATAIDRLATYVRQRTVDTIPPPGAGSPPAFVSQTPNEFPPPVPPGAHALAAGDASYSMAPFLLGPDEQLQIRAKWPVCRFANVSLWNRQMQTFDYQRHTVSLNRAQTVVDDDGWFTVTLAHEDPGVPNWLDTEGRGFGLVFWRYFLPEGPIETPIATVGRPG